ncbi:MAG: ADP-glyceromanno-heptose 6-epimerase [Candidatus Cloacimonetes bacterium]|nr:ADP-glyceromanno-heptose 6-epimerase [Candidatus Cloacimonadota bacterium]
MIIVTGGAGFIGSNLVAGLNNEGFGEILIVDSLGRSEKYKNLRGLRFEDIMDKSFFRDRLRSRKFDGKKIEAVFHQGACSDTTNCDGDYMLDNNYAYSRELLDYCLSGHIPFIYASSASVYGTGGDGFREAPVCEFPLNLYAFSKLLFDNYVRRTIDHAESQIVGLRYFNVFGPQENHKWRMASMVFHAFNSIGTSGTVRLFEGSDGYGPGEQRRDFLAVEDALKVNLFFLEHPEKSGIFNCGTGRSRSFLDLAKAVIKSVGEGKIEHIPFPEDLKGKYQSFTKADLSRLRSAGFVADFSSLEEAVERYVALLAKNGGYLFGEDG